MKAGLWLAPQHLHRFDRLVGDRATPLEVSLQQPELFLDPADSDPENEAPPESTSSAAACLAVRAALRWGRTSVEVPRRM